MRYRKGGHDLGLVCSPTFGSSCYMPTLMLAMLVSLPKYIVHFWYKKKRLLEYIKQKTILRFNSESEYISLVHACVETVRLAHLPYDLHILQHRLIKLYCNNPSITYMASNPVFHARTRHIWLNYHFVQEQVALGTQE